MPNNENNNQQNDSQNNNQNTTNNQSVTSTKDVVLGCDANDVADEQCQNTVESILQQAGYKVEKLGIDPNSFADYSYGNGGKHPEGKIGVYLMAGSLISYLDATDAKFDFNVLGIRGDVTKHGTEEGFKTLGVPQDWDGNYSHPRYDECAGKTYPELNELFKGRCVAVPGETPEKLGQNIVAAIQGQGFIGGGGSVVNSGGGAQVKDKTFERCIRRICAATDSVFIVDNNVAVLFPYVDWLAFTLRQKITTITKKEIDPNMFSTEYNNDGFYNKVSIAWGGATLPERFPKDKKEQESPKNYTMQDILTNMQSTNFTYKTPQENTVKTKKNKTTQTLSVDETGVSLLSEQYDSLVDKYGVLEKRVQSKAPDLETAQYIANALLIQYVRDFNNACKCRAISNKKYQGGTFYAVTNPYTDEVELQFLNGYSMRVQKKEPLYNDLDFRYGPESAENISDYQDITGGASGGGNQGIIAGSATEEQIWKNAQKACHQNSCGELRVEESDAQDPQVAEDYYNKMVKAGKRFCLTCYGMSAWLYFQFNYKAGIPCQVVGDSSHHVVMLDRGNGFVDTKKEYRQYLEMGYRWKNDQVTTVLLAAPNNTASVGGNTNNTSTGAINKNNK